MGSSFDRVDDILATSLNDRELQPGAIAAG
jgi:hypothetical protein